MSIPFLFLSISITDLFLACSSTAWSRKTIYISGLKLTAIFDELEIIRFGFENPTPISSGFLVKPLFDKALNNFYTSVKKRNFDFDKNKILKRVHRRKARKKDG